VCFHKYTHMHTCTYMINMWHEEHLIHTHTKTKKNSQRDTQDWAGGGLQKKRRSSSGLRSACCFHARNDMRRPPESAMSSPVHKKKRKINLMIHSSCLFLQARANTCAFFFGFSASMWPLHEGGVSKQTREATHDVKRLTQSEIAADRLSVERVLAELI
jgi:hypothetical protein